MKTHFLIRILILLTLYHFLFLSKCYATPKTLIDNFDSYPEGTEGLKTNWERIDDTWRISCTDQWRISEGKIGISIVQGDCVTNLIPKDSVWNNLGNNYEFEVDMTFVKGTDHNIAFRFVPYTSSGHDWYELHFQSPSDFSLGRFNNGYFITNTSGSYPNGNTYHIKIIINNNNLKTYINGELKKEYISYIDRFPHGKIALRAGTGSDPVSETWFDNIVVTSLDEVTPTPTPPTPAVFLPGLGGSINFKEMFLGDSDPGGWRMTPGAKVYDNLLKTFENNPDFHIFYYDWLKPVSETAQKLNDYIHNTINPWNNKVNLIGHSLGGLVARACIQKTANNCYADKLITVGSPHSGAVDAYPALEGGEIWRTGPAKVLYELFIRYHQRPGETRREIIERIAPVLKDLLPNFDYLIKNGSVLHPSSLSFQNSLLPILSDLSILENRTNTLTGRGFNTIEQIILTEPNWIDELLGDWPDGKPVDRQLTLEGDTSILVKSSSFSDPQIENINYDLDHGGIISEQGPLTQIMEILGLELKPGIYDSLNDEENFLAFLVHSPVKISSPDTTSDSYTTDELIIISNPENKNYTLNMEGIGDGYYILSVGQIFGENVYWHDYFDETFNGKNQSFIFSINPQSPLENPLLDPDGSSTISQLNSRINEFKKEIRDLKIKQKDKKTFLTLLNKIRKATKNPENAFHFLALLRQTIAEYEREGIISQEIANIFRNKASALGESLEFLAFLKPKQTSQSDAETAILDAENAKDSVNPENLNKNGAMVYVEAEEKLDKANQAFNKQEYYPAKIFAFEARNLFLESMFIK